MLGLLLLVAEGGGDLRGVGQPQLAPGPLVERGPAEAYDAGRGGPGDQLDLVAGSDIHGGDPVGLDGQPAAAGQNVQPELVLARDHQPAVVGRVRRDRRNHQGLHPRADDRPAGREAVGGRAGRRRDHDRVGRIADEPPSRGPYRHRGCLAPGEPDERDVVERRDDPLADNRVDG
jgi:hypothetical protein